MSFEDNWKKIQIAFGEKTYLLPFITPKGNCVLLKIEEVKGGICGKNLTQEQKLNWAKEELEKHT